mmetsp:Transcript_28287/g.46499  ORF Transcript_28287/g.46499 Transcript_28287/m.46499 type:complete len:370 (-) Transcript_28287:4585-5694(-)
MEPSKSGGSATAHALPAVKIRSLYISWNDTKKVDLQVYAKLLIKKIYIRSRICSYQKSGLMRVSQIARVELDFKNGRFPCASDQSFHETFNRLFQKFVTDKSRATNHDFYVHCVQAIQNVSTNIPLRYTRLKSLTHRIPVHSQRLLVMLDYDDTLIPYHWLKNKAFRVTEHTLSAVHRHQLESYGEQLNLFFAKLVCLVGAENIKIVTNASSQWVLMDSFCNCGALFADVLRAFNEKLYDAKIDIVSAYDQKVKHFKVFGRIPMQHLKRYLMQLLYYQHFGGKLHQGAKNVKIISIGDSWNEYSASHTALRAYLAQQSEDVVANVNVSLHRIKLCRNPDLKTLTRQLKWCRDCIAHIVYYQHTCCEYHL